MRRRPAGHAPGKCCDGRRTTAAVTGGRAGQLEHRSRPDAGNARLPVPTRHPAPARADRRRWGGV